MPRPIHNKFLRSGSPDIYHKFDLETLKKNYAGDLELTLSGIKGGAVDASEAGKEALDSLFRKLLESLEILTKEERFFNLDQVTQVNQSISAIRKLIRRQTRENKFSVSAARLNETKEKLYQEAQKVINLLKI